MNSKPPKMTAHLAKMIECNKCNQKVMVWPGDNSGRCLCGESAFRYQEGHYMPTIEVLTLLEYQAPAYREEYEKRR